MKLYHGRDKSYMTSSYMTFNLQYDFNIQCVHTILNTGHAHVQIY